MTFCSKEAIRNCDSYGSYCYGRNYKIIIPTDFSHLDAELNESRDHHDFLEVVKKKRNRDFQMASYVFDCNNRLAAIQGG